MTTRIPITRNPIGGQRGSQVGIGTRSAQDMRSDMDVRRKEWEGEIEKMRSDFFSMEPVSGPGNTDKFQSPFRAGKSNTLLGRGEDGKGVIEQGPDGTPLYRATFDLHAFSPDSIRVNTDDNRFVVSAKEQNVEGGTTTTREYKRELNIPNEVDAGTLHCDMSKEGLLTVEGKMSTPAYKTTSTAQVIKPVRSDQTEIRAAKPSPFYGSEHVIGVKTVPRLENVHVREKPTGSTFTNLNIDPSNQAMSNNPPGTSIFNATRSEIVTPMTSGLGSRNFEPTRPVAPTFDAPPSHIVSTAFDTRPSYVLSTTNDPSRTANVTASSFTNKASTAELQQSPISLDTNKKIYTIEVDIEDFSPENLNVKTIDGKLIVTATKEDKAGSRTSTKQMSREFTIPADVEPTSVKAFFTESGKLLIEAPYKIKSL